MPGNTIILFPHETDILLAALQRDLQSQSDLARQFEARRGACELNIYYVTRLIDLLLASPASGGVVDEVRRGREELALVLSA